MNRSRTSSPGLKHLAFFEALAESTENTPPYRAATAGLLALRLVDHWVLAGPAMVEPESVSVRSVREAIMAIEANDPQRESLLGLVNAMQTQRTVDLQPILPRVFAYARALEQRGNLALAADAYGSVVRLADDELEATLIIDSHMRLGYCLRKLAKLSEAEAAYVSAGKIAKRRREKHRLYRSQIGLANVAAMRGNLPKADEMLQEIVDLCSQEGFRDVSAFALHDHSIVARQRGNFDSAVCRAYEALTLANSDGHRERILGDLGACFVAMGRFQAARDALLVEEATAVTVASRTIARINLVALAARLPDEQLFERCRQELAGLELAPDVETNYLIECARGLRVFGKDAEAEMLLTKARDTARSHDLNLAVHEAELMLAQKVADAPTQNHMPVPSAAAVRVEGELRIMAAALAD